METISLDWTLLVGLVIFLSTLFMLNRLLFRPLFEVLDERRARTSELRRKADEVVNYQESLFEKYQQRIKEERQACYKLAESLRSSALEERQKRISSARQTAEDMLEESMQQVQKELETAKEQLKSEAAEIARAITSRVLERKVRA
ncbi:MAG: ATP synthase F0 subunit B [Acidobacteriota bacterium]